MTMATAGMSKRSTTTTREFGLHVYGDDWKWTDNHRYRWREHDGRGYWNKGVWIEF